VRDDDAIKCGDITPVATEISLRRVVGTLIRGEAHVLVSVRYRVHWLLWFWAGKNANPKNAHLLFRPYKGMRNTVAARSFSSAISRCTCDRDQSPCRHWPLGDDERRAEARDAVIEVDYDGHLAFVVSRNWTKEWLEEVSFGSVRLEPVID
jgi:hypothetical protein